jgi:hypothetical protein
MKDEVLISKKKELEKKGEIDLLSLAKTVWEGRGTIIKTAIIFVFLGLFVALFNEKEYVASSIMVPQIENQSPKFGGLSSLASLAGVNMDMNAGASAISPVLYPKIISSVDFQLDIMNAEYRFEGLDEPISLTDYYLTIHKKGLFGILKEYTIGLPRLITSAIRKRQAGDVIDPNYDINKLTLDQEEVRKIIEKNLSLEVNDSEGYLTLISRFPEANLSAQVAKEATKLLQAYVTMFKVEKATAQLEFVRDRYKENKGEFEEAQSKLAAFRDANRNISSEIVRTHEERLQYDYQLAFEVYSELAKQLEQSLIKVEENTPVFSIIQDVVVPIKKSKPRRTFILMISLILGGVAGVIIVFGRPFLRKFHEEWRQ